MRRFAATGLCLALLAARAHADRVDDLVKAQMTRRRIPGVAVTVVRNGRVVLARGYGLANVECGTPVTPRTVFEIGSMTKQFTATAVMMLVGEGRVGLDEKIARYLPGLPEAWKDVTVRHLLTHTSGIRGYTEVVPDFLKLCREEHKPEEIVGMVSGLPLDFAPGTKWAYSNTGYYLLGMLVEKASGKPYDTFLRERIFQPLGMTATRNGDPAAIIPRRAAGYMGAGGLRNAPLLQPTSAFSAGELVSTVLDLARWDAALYTGRVLPQAVLRQMWTPGKLADGKATGYGFGWFVGAVNGRREVDHGGGTAGFSAKIVRYLDDRLTVIVLTNRMQIDAGPLSRGIAGCFVPALAPPPEKPPRSPADNDPATTRRLRQVLESLAAGTLGPEPFTPRARAELFPDRAKQAAGFLQPLGPLRQLVLVARTADGTRRALRYRAAYRDTALMVTFVLVEDGAIAEMSIAPE